MAKKISYIRYNISEDWENVNDNYKNLVYNFCKYLKEENKSEDTIRKYEHNLKLFGVWVYKNLENKPFYKLELEDFEMWFNQLDRQETTTNRMKVLKSTLSSLSNYCISEYNLDENYLYFSNLVIDAHVPDNNIATATNKITEEQYDILIQYLILKQMWREALYVYLAYNTNLKKSEIVALRKSDLREDEDIMLYKILKEWYKQRVDSLDYLFVAQHRGVWRKIHGTTLNEWCVKFGRVIGVEISPVSFKK